MCKTLHCWKNCFGCSVHEKFFWTQAKVACVEHCNAGHFCFNTGHSHSVVFIWCFCVLTKVKVAYVDVSNAGHLSLNAGHFCVACIVSWTLSFHFCYRIWCIIIVDSDQRWWLVSHHWSDWWLKKSILNVFSKCCMYVLEHSLSFDSVIFG